LIVATIFRADAEESWPGPSFFLFFFWVSISTTLDPTSRCLQVKGGGEHLQLKLRVVPTLCISLQQGVDKGLVSGNIFFFLQPRGGLSSSWHQFFFPLFGIETEQ